MSDIEIQYESKKNSPKIRKTIDSSFKEQQKEILNKLLDALHIDTQNPQEYLIEKSILESYKTDIELLLNDIIKYYHSNVWNTIKQSNKKYMSICRQIFKHHLIGFSSKVTTAIIDGKSTKITKYHIKFN